MELESDLCEGLVPTVMVSVEPVMIVHRVLDLKRRLTEAGRYGPYTAIFPNEFQTLLDRDYPFSTKCFLKDRILQIEGISRIVFNPFATTITLQENSTCSR